MTTTRRALLPLTLGLLAPVSWSRNVLAFDANGRLAVVVARSSPLQSIGFYELKRLYLGETVNGTDGMRLLPLNLPIQSNERVRFDRSVLGMTPEQTARYWVDRKIRGQTGAPKSVELLDTLQRAVAQLRGAVGYCRVEDVREGLKVIRVEGKLPTDGGYPVAL